jgi:hypothetical protein
MAVVLSNDDLKYLLDEAKATLAACEKKYDFTGGLVIENEWEAKLDRGRWAIWDKSRRRYLRFSSLEEADVHATIETIARTLSR